MSQIHGNTNKKYNNLLPNHNSNTSTNRIPTHRKVIQEAKSLNLDKDISQLHLISKFQLEKGIESNTRYIINDTIDIDDYEAAKSSKSNINESNTKIKNNISNISNISNNKKIGNGNSDGETVKDLDDWFIRKIESSSIASYLNDDQCELDDL